MSQPAAIHRDLPIGVFDSGIGGLTVLRALRAVLPGEDFLYLGDTARLPYGNKAPETVQRYSVNIARFLAAEGVKAMVIACNTASAYAFGAVSASVPVPVVDVVGPVAKAVAEQSSTGRVLVLGTRGTVKSRAYVNALKLSKKDLHVVQQACPLFVPLAEEGWVDGQVPEEVATRYLEDIVASARVDSAILGCTHYPLLRDVVTRVIDRYSPTAVTIHDSGRHTAIVVRDRLRELDLLRPRESGGHSRYQVTDDPEAFLPVGTRFLGEPVIHAEHVDVGG